MGLLTGDDLAKHAKLLPRKVIRNLGHMLHQPWYASGNWESVAENLGYGYEEIQHFALMSSMKQDVTPGELMLHNWVQQTCGRTIFVLYTALNKADRSDCLQYLEQEIYDCVICTELMICIKYEDGRSTSHQCVKTRADSSLLESLRTHLEHPILEKYELLDVGVSWTRTLAKEFKGRQLMLLRRQDCCNMEQDPTVDSSCSVIGSPPSIPGNQIPLPGNQPSVTGNQHSSPRNHLPAPRILGRMISDAEMTCDQTSRHFQRITPTQSTSLTGSQTVPGPQFQPVSGTSSTSVTDTQSKITSISANLDNNVHRNRSSDGAVGYISSISAAAVVPMVTRNSSDNVTKMVQNDLNMTSEISQHVMDTTCNISCCEALKNGQKCKDITSTFSSEMLICSEQGISKSGSISSVEDNRLCNPMECTSDMCKDLTREDWVENYDSSRTPNEYLQPVGSAFGAEVVEIKRLHCNKKQVETFPVEDSDYSDYKDFDMNEYNPPERISGQRNKFKYNQTQTESALETESISVSASAVDSVLISQGKIDNDVVSDAQTSQDDINNNVRTNAQSEMDSTIPINFALGELESTNEIETDNNVDEYLLASCDSLSDISVTSNQGNHGNVVEFEGEPHFDLEETEYQYTSWGILDEDDDVIDDVIDTAGAFQNMTADTDKHSNTETVTSANSLPSGINKCCLLPRSKDSENSLGGRRYPSSGEFSTHSDTSDDRIVSTGSVTFGKKTSFNIDQQRVAKLTTDLSKNQAEFTENKKSQLYLDFNKFDQEPALVNSDENDSSDSENAATNLPASFSQMPHFSNHSRVGRNFGRIMSMDPEQTFKKTPYETLQRGLSCPSEFVYNFSNTPIIADVFSPVTDRPKSIVEESEETSIEQLSASNSSSSLTSLPAKRHTLPITVQCENPKRSRNSLPTPKSEHVRFKELGSQSLTHPPGSPSLPPRKNLPDLRRSSFQSEYESPNKIQIDPESAPCKIVIAGKSSRPPLDNLIADDKLFQYYQEHLHEYPGWCPKETENTIEKTMKFALTSDGYYILWYMRARKSLVLSVSHQHKLVNYRIHTKIISQHMTFYISQGHYFRRLHELLHYYHDNGVRVNINEPLDHHSDRIQLKCPVKVQYGRNQPVSV